MTLDIATLNLRVDSREVEQGVGQLDRLATSGAKAEQSTARMGREFVQAGSAAGKLRMEEASLEAEVQRLITAQQRAAVTTRAQEIAQQRLGQTVVKSAGAQRAGMQQLSYQLGDVSTMFAMGARPMQIFASQGGQVIQSLQLMTGASSGFMGLLAGPWGIAITSAVTVLGALWASTREEEAAITDLDQAFDFAALSANQLTQVNQLLSDSNREVAATAIQAARAMGVRAQANANNATAELRRAQAELGRLNAVFDASAAAGVIPDTGRMTAASNRIRELNAIIPQLRSEVRTATADVAIMTAGLSEQEAQVEALTSRQNDLRNAYVRTGDTGALQQAVALQAQIDELGKSTDRATGSTNRAATATRTMTTSLRDEARAATEASRALKDVEEQAQAAADKEQEYADRLNNKIKVAAGEANQAREEAEAAARDARERADEEARRRGEEQIRELSSLYETLFTDGVDGVWDVFKKQGLAAISQIAAQWTLSLLSGQSGSTAGNPLSAIGAIFGQQGAANDNGIGSIIGAVTGAKGAASTGATGGAGGTMTQQLVMQAMAVPGLGEAIAAAAVTQVIGEGIEKLTGLRFDMLGGLFGGVIGGFAVGAIKGAVKGVATIGNDGGVLGVTDSFGKTKFKDKAVGDATSILDVLGQIAQGLGTSIDSSLGAVSIGTRNGKYRVDGSGSGITKTGQGAIDFGKDQEAAIEYAIRNLIEDGILGPISEASKRILTAGGDLEKAIEKAAMIEALPKLLKERLDPLGYALDTIDEQFGKLRDALNEGAATAQQYADAEKLYKLEREDAIKQFGAATATLTDFLQSLAFGSNSPLSIRQQMMSAEAAFSTFESDIAAGKPVDQDKFTSAAQTLLGLSRTANASSGAYFSTFDRVKALTQQAITNVGTSVPGEGAVVFQQQTASNTQSIARMMEDQNALLREQNELLRGANDNGGKKSKFIGSSRGFVA